MPSADRDGLGPPVMPSSTTPQNPQNPQAPAGSAPLREGIQAALEVLAAEGCVAFPSETVWGLAGSARSVAAISALATWKGRADDQPISVLVSGEAALLAYGFEVSPLARTLMNLFWPGPLTLVLPCRAAFAPGIARGDGSVGVRCSSHPVAAALVVAAESVGLGPLTATSCNASGEPPARTEAEARVLCSSRPGGPYLLAPGDQDAGSSEPSTVLDLVAVPPQILREGGVSAATLRPLLETSNAKLGREVAEPHKGETPG